MKYNLSLIKDKTFKCIDSKWYYKEKGQDSFANHDGRGIVDMYLTHYSAFNASASGFTARDWNVDDSGYKHNVDIYVVDGKITNISDESSNNSSTLTVAITFSDYGTTTL